VKNGTSDLSNGKVKVNEIHGIGDRIQIELGKSRPAIGISVSFARASFVTCELI
jgi:hypothetical protein